MTTSRTRLRHGWIAGLFVAGALLAAAPAAEAHWWRPGISINLPLPFIPLPLPLPVVVAPPVQEYYSYPAYPTYGPVYYGGGYYRRPYCRPYYGGYSRPYGYSRHGHW